jgi:hypothetical protein
VLQRLERAFLAQERFIANAAHELKTPLALARARIEAGLDADDDRQRLLHDLDAMVRQVQQMLQMAQVADPQALRRRPVRPLAVAREVLDHLAFKAERRDLTLHLQEPAGELQVEADPGALFVLLKNLVENAIEFSPPGADVGVWLDEARLRVDDHGPGVTPEHRAAGLPSACAGALEGGALRQRGRRARGRRCCAGPIGCPCRSAACGARSAPSGPQLPSTPRPPAIFSQSRSGPDRSPRLKEQLSSVNSADPSTDASRWSSARTNRSGKGAADVASVARQAVASAPASRAPAS